MASSDSVLRHQLVEALAGPRRTHHRRYAGHDLPIACNIRLGERSRILVLPPKQLAPALAVVLSAV